MRLSQFFCTSTSQNLSVSFHLSALMTTFRSHRAASTIHSTGRAEFLLLGTCRGSYSSWKNCSLQQLFFYSTRIHIYRLLLQGPQDIERISPVLFHSHLRLEFRYILIPGEYHTFCFFHIHEESISLALSFDSVQNLLEFCFVLSQQDSVVGIS